MRPYAYPMPCAYPVTRHKVAFFIHVKRMRRQAWCN